MQSDVTIDTGPQSSRVQGSQRFFNSVLHAESDRGLAPPRCITAARVGMHLGRPSRTATEARPPGRLVMSVFSWSSFVSGSWRMFALGNACSGHDDILCGILEAPLIPPSVTVPWPLPGSPSVEDHAIPTSCAGHDLLGCGSGASPCTGAGQQQLACGDQLEDAYDGSMMDTLPADSSNAAAYPQPWL